MTTSPFYTSGAIDVEPAEIGIALAIIGIVIPLLLWALDRSKRSHPQRKRVNVNLALLGLKSAGKTRLVWQWSKAEIIKREQLSPTPSRTIYQLARAERPGRDNVLQPVYNIYDFGGEQPGQFLDEAASAWFRALIIVVDHTPYDDSIRDPDSGRLAETIGYTKGLVRAFLQSGLSRWLQIVIVFINKADLMTTEERRKIIDRYAELIQIARTGGRTVKVYVGSAQEGWKVMNALADLDMALL